MKDVNITIDDLTGEFKQLAEDIGLDVALRLVDLRGGESIYIPPLHRVLAGHRDREMFKKWNRGVSPAELAREYDMSETRIRIILNEMRAERQKTVFDLLKED